MNISKKKHNACVVLSTTLYKTCTNNFQRGIPKNMGSVEVVKQKMQHNSNDLLVNYFVVHK